MVTLQNTTNMWYLSYMSTQMRASGGKALVLAEEECWNHLCTQLAPHAAIRHTILLSLNYVAAMPAKEECQSIAY